MAKVELKTKKNNKSVTAFLNSVEDEGRRKDAKAALKLFKEITKAKPKMWGDSIVGFGDWHYKSARTNREADFLVTGFSPRKTSLTFYIMPGYTDYSDLMKKLGPHKLGKSCLYIKNLDDIHIPTLKKLIKAGIADMKKRYKGDVKI